MQRRADYEVVTEQILAEGGIVNKAVKEITES